MNGHYTPGCGEEEKMFCDVCGAEMNAQRNVNGATSRAEAMGKRSHLHDVFTCPDRKEQWHLQAYKLQQKIAKSVSRVLADLMQGELNQILKTRKSTVDHKLYESSFD